MKQHLILGSLFGLSLILGGCTKTEKKEEKSETKKAEQVKVELKTYPTTPLPADIKWETNNEDPVYASDKAVKGGTFNTWIQTFPLTVRNVGPDANGSFRSEINDNRLALVALHPNTNNYIPELATHWAYSNDMTTAYYKLDPNARWSDGEKVTADDYLFMLEMMRSKHIMEPWANNFYSTDIVDIQKHDDYTISVKSNIPRSKFELIYYTAVSPRPRHFHKLDENWVKDYNWKIEPTTGPYQITEIDKGKKITFERDKNWWAADYKYNKHRFNVDKVVFTLYRDINVAWENFLKGNIDHFIQLIYPDYWYEKSKAAEFANGYINKVWFYNQMPRYDQGMWMNMSLEIFKDINVRKAFSHAMNIDKVNKEVLRGDFIRLNGPTVGYGEYENKDIKPLEFSIEKVKENMEKSGWKRGADGIWAKGNQRFSVEVMYGNTAHTERIVVLKEEALKAGIELKIKQVDPSAAFKTFREKKHEVAYMGWAGGERPDYWGQYHSDNANKPQTNNIANIIDKELDEYIMGYKTAIDEKIKVEFAHKVQKRLMEIVAYVPTYNQPYYREGYWRYWKFPEIPATKSSREFMEWSGTRGGLFWLDEKAKEETLAAKKEGKKFPPVVDINETYKQK